jgi:ParB family chromosome partitioning protein
MTKANSRNAKASAKPIPETKAMDIPFNRLRLSDKNVRTIYDKSTVAELAESIAEHGLIQSLSVRPLRNNEGDETGDYEVQAGGRRFRALELLAKKKRRPSDALTPCVIKTAGLAEDDSYVENAEREALHPIDQFRAFKAMKDAGCSESEISTKHRVTVGFVRQRLRLAAASPAILQAYRDEEIDLDQLMAFCVTDDHSRQNSVWERVKNSWNSDAHQIRQLLTEDTVPSNDPRVIFIGMDAYEKAGGAVERDLFSSTNDGYLKDAELLNRLVADALEQHRQHYLAMGWKWVEAAISFPHDAKWGLDRLIGEDAPLTAKEHKQLRKLTTEMEDLDKLDELDDAQDARREEVECLIHQLENKPPVFTPEDMATGGVFISLNRQGQLVIDAGFIKEDDRPQDDGARADGDTNAHDNGHANGHEAEEVTETQNKPLSASLIEDLTSYRTVAIRDAMAQDFNVAFTAVVHALALHHYYTFASGKTCLQLKLDTSFPCKAPGLDQWGPTKAITDRDLAWKKLLPKSSSDLWSALLGMDQTTRQGIFTHLASLAVNAVRSPHVHRGDVIQHADQLVSALGLDIVKAGWVTTAENYLNRVSKGRISEAVTEARGEETATLISDLKKDKMAAEAQRLLDGTGWLPEALRCGEAATPAEDDEADLDGDDNGDTEGLPDFLSANEADAASA